jgi:two-component system KDP operon response regulator KdpE
MKALVVGNDEALKDISFCLQLRWPNAVIVHAAEGSKGIDLVKAEVPDLVIADLRLPDMSGLELVGKVRRFSDVPQIVLTDDMGEMVAAKALEAGADDCMTKPFNIVQFLTRVNALFRRAYAVGLQPDQLPICSGDLTISLFTHEVFLSGKPVKLTPHEYNLLFELVRNEGKVLSHHIILEKVWGTEYADDSGILKKYVCCLRRKLGDDAQQPHIILNERGVGYKFVRSA